jgi:phenylacetate-CoA ligase
VNLFPSQIESVLLEMKEIKPHYILIVDRINNLDSLELKFEVEDEYFQDKISELQSLRDKIRNTIESATGLSLKVTLVEPKTLERSEGKSKRVIDNRKF